MSLLLAALAVAAFQPDPAVGCGLLTLTRTPSMSRLGSERIEVCLQPGPRNQDRHYRLILTRIPRNAAPITLHASTRTCRGARERLIEAERLALPSIEIIQRDRMIVVTADGTNYRLEARWAPYGAGGQHGSFSVESNIGTPLARWAETLFATLAPCWRA